MPSVPPRVDYCTVTKCQGARFVFFFARNHWGLIYFFHSQKTCLEVGARLQFTEKCAHLSASHNIAVTAWAYFLTLTSISWCLIETAVNDLNSGPKRGFGGEPILVNWCLPKKVAESEYCRISFFSIPQGCATKFWALVQFQIWKAFKLAHKNILVACWGMFTQGLVWSFGPVANFIFTSIIGERIITLTCVNLFQMGGSSSN